MNLKLRATIAVIASVGLFLGITPPSGIASSNCYWDGDTLAGDLSNCVIDLGPIAPTPVPTDTPLPSASETPMPQAPTKKMEEIARKPLHQVKVSSYISDDVDYWAIDRVSIIDLTDARFGTQCFWALECKTEIPEGHRFRVQISSSKAFVASSGRSLGTPATLVLGTVFWNEEHVSQAPMKVSLVFIPSPFSLEIRTDDDFVIKSFSENVLNGFEHTAYIGENISIKSDWKSSHPLRWEKLPKGLKLGADGEIFGKPTTPGNYRIIAKAGVNSKVTYVLNLTVKSRLSPPTVVKATPQGISSSDLTFAAGITEQGTKPDYYEFKFTPISGETPTLRIVDGDAKSAVIPRLNPGQTYTVVGRSCLAKDGACSYWSDSAKLEMPSLKPKYKLSNNIVEIDERWQTGSISSVAATVTVLRGKKFELKLSKATTISAADIKLFKATFRGLELLPNGTITGSLKYTTTKNSKEFTVGNIKMSFFFIAK